LSFVKSSGEVLSTLRTVFLTRSQWIGYLWRIDRRTATEVAMIRSRLLQAFGVITSLSASIAAGAAELSSPQNSRRHHVDLRFHGPAVGGE